MYWASKSSKYYRTRIFDSKGTMLKNESENFRGTFIKVIIVLTIWFNDEDLMTETFTFCKFEYMKLLYKFSSKVFFGKANLIYFKIEN